MMHHTAQILLPSLTIAGQAALALKRPELGLLLMLLAQPFWLYSSWQAYRRAGQSGIFITTIIFTVITAAGVANYWL